MAQEEMMVYLAYQESLVYPETQDATLVVCLENKDPLVWLAYLG